MTKVASQSVTTLAAERQAVFDSFGNTDDEATDLQNMERLYEVEKRIEESTYDAVADKLIGNQILMENKPSNWDDFQENLFLRMQQFA